MLDYALLDALAEVIRHGSFERAAKALNVSPSAVSQRVKLLEERVGSVLVKRGQPCVATTSGALLCRHTERVRMLEAELSGHMPAFAGAQAGAWPTLRVAVNDDSVATWFVDAVGPFCAQSGTLLDLVIDDQDYTAERIRDGSVQGAVTALAEPIQGCRSTRLGRMRYHAVCSPAFHARYFGNGVNRDALRRAPCVMFNPKDSLQARFIRRVTRIDLDPPQHWIPHVAGYLRACEAGLGWGMCPERMVERQIAEGGLIDLSDGRSIDIELYWQSWRLSIGWLDEFSAALKASAAQYLD
ncbi:LysR family transcriptional regulator [Burkholderia pseudomallei]|uniref:LysR family transcriptional regulator ArgP n=1 Tax=Burkholderia pseudomallei TaxID=28450 RepID=UPI000530D7FC|nr:LysR family transcriptional regulator ArgP [Burkholderia pseudomallei]APZ02303.1 transcriptional regulator ArgP [Burkholderia pseudomallei]APZ15887.1 transcriptional regulator ArgP [Burkholderia pseudomallei]KGS04569.1 transcriptional regulator, LysR family [Burkholderia pseudomallei MSHR7504]KGU76143.1 transcriptional regulator, LysR family [Burkholderia pseudomallei MSHR4304]KGV39168.1 transcriptional regulator, LysR family [Burkholderia pseudomallei MSHR4308]